MITSVEIYGHPYAAETYNLLSTDDIADIFNSVRNIDLAIKYIDGIFAIHLVYHNGKNVWITDPFGEYPIFVNEKDANIVVNFKPGNKYDKNDVYYMLATKNSDKGYHSNIVAGSSHIPMVTPWRNWNVAEPCSIYTIKNREISHRKYQLYRYETKETYVDIFASIIKNMAENRKVLLPLSAGYDSRGIYGVIKGSGIAYSRYTYGNEKQFVNRMDNSESCMPEFDGDYNSQVSKHILSMNGMGDIYFKCHNFYIQDYWKEYDILFTGDGGNEFLCKDDMSHSYVYATGDGHHYKTQADRIITISPYCSKKLLNAANRQGLSRKEIITTIIRECCPSLLGYEFYSGDSMTNNKYSNFGHSFQFNTKLKYLQQYYEKMSDD